MKKEIKVEVIRTIKRIADDKKPFSIDILKWGDGKPKLNIRHMYKDKETYSDDEYVSGDDKPGDMRSDDKPYINDPDNKMWLYGEPRDIWFGINISF